MAGVPEYGGTNGDGLEATESWLYLPHDITPMPDGSFYIADGNNHVIRLVDADGVSTVVVGSGFPDFGHGGPARVEPLHDPTAVVLDPDDPETLWLALPALSKVGRVCHDTIRYPYGNGDWRFGGDGGEARLAALNRPTSLAFHRSGALYVSDRMNQVVRRIDEQGIITTAVGRPGEAGYSGDGGPADEARIATVPNSERDPANSIDIDGDRMVLADTGNDVLREIDLHTGIITTLLDGLDRPHDVDIGPDGSVLFSDTGRACVRVLRPDGSVETVLGVCDEPGIIEDGVAATRAHLAYPAGVAWGPDGSVWAADTLNHVVVRVVPKHR